MSATCSAMPGPSISTCIECGQPTPYHLMSIRGRPSPGAHRPVTSEPDALVVLDWIRWCCEHLGRRPSLTDLRYMLGTSSRIRDAVRRLVVTGRVHCVRSRRSSSFFAFQARDGSEAISKIGAPSPALVLDISAAISLLDHRAARAATRDERASITRAMQAGALDVENAVMARDSWDAKFAGLVSELRDALSASQVRADRLTMRVLALENQVFTSASETTTTLLDFDAV